MGVFIMSLNLVRRVGEKCSTYGDDGVCGAPGSYCDMDDRKCRCEADLVPVWDGERCAEHQSTTTGETCSKRYMSVAIDAWVYSRLIAASAIVRSNPQPVRARRKIASGTNRSSQTSRHAPVVMCKNCRSSTSSIQRVSRTAQSRPAKRVSSGAL